MRLICTVCLFGIFSMISPVFGQETNGDSGDEKVSYVRLFMHDGSTRMGELRSMNESEIRLKMPDLGEVLIPKYLVKGLIEMDGNTFARLSKSNMGRSLAINPQSSRYFFAPSGIQLKKGEGYFQSNIALNSVSLGINDNLTLGGLISFVGAGGTLKIGKSLAPNVHVSCGGIGFSDYYGGLERPIGLIFGNITWGTDDRNITINLGTGSKIETGIQATAYSMDTTGGAGYAQYTVTEYEQNYVRPLLLSVSGMTQIGENRWFITENYFINNYQYSTLVTGANLTYYYLPNSNFGNQNRNVVIVSMGVRNLSQRNGWLWDYGIVGVKTADFGFAAPWVSATLPF